MKATDVAGESNTALTFRILGDGKEPWKSEPVKHPIAITTFDVSIEGVRELTAANPKIASGGEAGSGLI